MKDFYHVLGVSRDASADEIKKVYRRLARQYHPDMNKGDKKSEERFKEISEAYGVLGDPEKRKQYDMFGGAPFGSAAGEGGGGFGGMRWEQAPGGGFRFYTSADPNAEGGAENFDQFGGMGDIFSELFNMGGFKRGRSQRGGAYEDVRSSRGRAEPQKGGDTFTDLEIDFMEALEGTEARLAIKRGDKTEKITVKIPAGVDNGSKVRIAGKGHPGIAGGEAGDLYINVKVRPNDIFWREDSDIYTEVPISIFEAVLGGNVEVPTIAGHADMKIPAGTASGQKFRLKGKGAPLVGKKTTGDQFVIVQIVPPKKIDERARQMFEELSRSAGYNPRQ